MILMDHTRLYSKKSVVGHMIGLGPYFFLCSRKIVP